MNFLFYPINLHTCYGGVRGCGNPECGVASGPDDSYSFGSGDLDENGFWSKPCFVCSKRWYDKWTETTWPYSFIRIIRKANHDCQESRRI